MKNIFNTRAKTLAWGFAPPPLSGCSRAGIFDFAYTQNFENPFESIREPRLWLALFLLINSSKAGINLSEEMGFEPMMRLSRIHAFQACSFGHSDTLPKKLKVYPTSPLPDKLILKTKAGNLK